MTDGDREKLAREMMGALAFFENGAVKQVTTFNQCADIAIAYADRRVAEAVNVTDVLLRKAFNKGWDGAQSGSPHLNAMASMLRALSPARDGGE